MSAEAGDCVGAPLQIRKGKVRRGKRCNQPRAASEGQLRRAPGFRRVGRTNACDEGINMRFLEAFLNLDSMAYRKITKMLDEATRPANRRLHGRRGITKAEEKFLRVLGKKTRAGLNEFHLTLTPRLHNNRRADGIAIARTAAQPKSD